MSKRKNDFDKIDSKPERIPLKKFNETLAYINDETDNTSSTISVIDFEDLKDFEKEWCKGTEKLRQLCNLLGIWQVDRDAIKKVSGVLLKLGVCNSHFQFDNNKSLSKKVKDFNERIIQWCQFLVINILPFSRGVGCTVHS
ncbi:hypothetical protein C1645_818971 [Glomus cerebriforme]|uniref:Uncharacterized protein n=1 Tax=Glomus cerebriforme TaxID=658196 RepID=A0A397TBH4_9GLOM|nr:hypothetical protein C1645_818971 [Glomus cerebriforme]